MRLFIAIPLPESIKNYAVELQKQCNIGRMSFVHPNSMHLTLIFLGEIDEKKIPRLKESLKQITFEPFALSTESVGLLGNKDYLRVLYLGLQSSELLNKLSADIDLALKPFKIKRDFPFLAHITLSRIKILIPEEKENLRKRVVELTKHIQHISFDVSAFRLYESKLTPNGPVYNSVESFDV